MLVHRPGSPDSIIESAARAIYWEGVSMDTAKLMQCLKEETAKIETSHRSAVLSRMASKYYKQAPKSDEKLLEFCEQLIAANNMDLFSIATLWIKKRETVFDLQYFSVIESWLFKYINHWGTCDQFCYRVLNPFGYKYPQLYTNVLAWMRSPKLYVRRAAPVSLIRSGTSFSVDYDLDKVLTVVEGLKDDPHHHIQKAIGWLLKYTYLTYPEQILDYLRRNVSTLSRTAFRYALEKVPQDIRQEMMQL